ncbi:leucine-rich repeat-containing protein 43 [Zonotrichia leucophrys gambelii]|uniref:leucine-rich repeat-containing protein 43 n=1 Tax=Zonotrichia leucophrys gambelii TaxID=257770 RepID=UPI0031407AC1
MAAPGSISAVFQQYLQHLGLQDFPCGLGNWNKSRCNARRSSQAQSVGLEEVVPPGEDTPEVLLELLRDQHSPWALPSDCSPQAQRLREVIVLAPELLHGSSVSQLVKSLRILDKGVEEVDEGLLQFQQLEELILSANHISRVTSAHLPRTLKVLELCHNDVDDLQELCAQPPPELQHLGLGYNQLCGPSQEKHFTVDFWPNLVSLDLSFNSLTDLLELVSQLSTLQKLRILLLQGNPLSLIPAYRGFLVDSLPRLSIFDDIYIWPEERQQFHRLAEQPELITSEARLVVSIGEMKGLPYPEDFQQLEPDCEGPVIAYRYCVTYQFAEGEELKDRGSPEGTEIHQSTTVATLDVDSSAQDTGETKSHQEPAATEEPEAHSAKVFATPAQPWADTIDCSYRKQHIAKDLVGLKSYLEAGTIVSVMEEKVVSWPVDPDENSATKEGQELKKNSAKDKQKKKKKKKSCEYRSDPPIWSTLATTRVTLETLLANENLVATLCDFGILIPEKPPEPPVVDEKETKKGKDKSKKPKGDQKNAASKGKGKNKDTAELEEDQEPQPVPLTVQFQMQLLRWPSAASTKRQESVAMSEGKTP